MAENQKKFNYDEEVIKAHFPICVKYVDKTHVMYTYVLRFTD